MVTTVTLNPCIDFTIKMPGVTLGQLNVADSTRTDTSGKGVNVSVVLKALGIPTLATGLSFSGNGGKLSEHLRAHGIPGDFITAPGDIRTNVKLVDTTTNVMTELNSRGDLVGDDILSIIPSEIAKRAADSNSDIVIFSGRIPNGARSSIIADCMRAMGHLPLKIIVDAEMAPLLEAVAAKPYLIKPNAFELAHTFGCKADTIDDILAACSKVIAMGAQVVCVSMGGEGAVIADADSAYRAEALDIVPKGFQGAGDSMVAGICKAMTEGGDISQMLRYGIAAASGSLIREGTLLCGREDFDRFLPQVKIERLK